MKKSISVVIPLYNEENGLETTINNVKKIVKEIFNDYELLIFDDCSTDKTGGILDKLTKNNPKIRIFHNKRNMNLGYNLKMGILNARKKYVMLLPGPDNMTIDSIKNFMEKIGDKAMITSYVGNPKSRRMYRMIISSFVTHILNLLFNLHFKYFFGIAAYETSLVKKVKMSTNSFALLTEIKVRLVKCGYSYAEIPVYVHKGRDNSTTAFRIRNVISVIATVLKLFFETSFRRNTKFNQRI